MTENVEEFVKKNKTNLKKLIGMLDNLDMLVEEENEETTDYCMRIIKDSGNYLYEMRKDLFDIAKEFEPSESQNENEKDTSFIESFEEFSFENHKTYYRFCLPELTKGYRIARSWNEKYVDTYIKNAVWQMVKENIIDKGIEPINGKFTVVFVHHYSKDNNPGDVDNFAIKKPIDGLHPFLVQDDSCRLMSLYQYGIKDEKAFTEMLVIPGDPMTDMLKKILDDLSNG